MSSRALPWLSATLAVDADPKPRLAERCADPPAATLWRIVFDRMNVPLPGTFQGGEADGTTGKLV
jgi:hypothetical protein